MVIKNTLIGGAVLISAAVAVVETTSYSNMVVRPVTAGAVDPSAIADQPDAWTQGDTVQWPKKPAIDQSGAERLGKASFYADFFAGRKMADGKIMNPAANNAASRTLPLGTTAKVTNLETGKSALVVIQDRGPYVDGRIVDLSPATAHQIGLTTRQGIAKVAVAPITVPMPDGRVKLGAGVKEPQFAANLSN